ncbi:MAG: hypothetical protein ACYCXG_00685 [Acidiferrobacter sp.]
MPDGVGGGAVWPPQGWTHLSRKTHFRRVGPEVGLVVAVGDPARSRFAVFEYVITTVAFGMMVIAARIIWLGMTAW